MLESTYQRRLVKKIKARIPDSEVLINDPQRKQGISDLLVLSNGRWGMLEVKPSENSPARPNQPWYVEHFNKMGFASFIYPENEEQVLGELQQALRPERRSRVSKSK